MTYWVRALSLAALLLLLAGCSQVPMIGQRAFGDKKVMIYGQHRAGQEFFSTDRNLARVDIFLNPSQALKGKTSLKERRPALKRLTGKNVHVRIFSWPEKKLIVDLKQPAKKIRSADMYAFPFPPLSGSKQRRYYFEVHAPALAKNQAVSVSLTSIDRYSEGQAFVDGRAVEGSDLRFLPYIKMNARMLINSGAARLSADLGFLIFWATIVLAALVLTILAWRRAGSAT